MPLISFYLDARVVWVGCAKLPRTPFLFPMRIELRAPAAMTKMCRRQFQEALCERNLSTAFGTP